MKEAADGHTPSHNHPAHPPLCSAGIPSTGLLPCKLLTPRPYSVGIDRGKSRGPSLGTRLLEHGRVGAGRTGNDIVECQRPVSASRMGQSGRGARGS